MADPASYRLHRERCPTRQGSTGSATDQGGSIYVGKAKSLRNG